MACIFNKLTGVRIRRADRNDANEIVALEDMRREGLTPAARVRMVMDAAEMPSLGALDWNRRQDLISAAPDAE